MTRVSSGQDFLFDILTPLGFRVRVSHSYWEYIVSIKHPVMVGRIEDVKETLSHPYEIRQSRSDSNVYLFYKNERIGRWVCAVSKRMDEETGFLVTTYPTDVIKEGARIWPK